MAGAGDVPDLLPLVDGILLTGSPSNVDATRYEATALDTDLLDPRRDALTMALVPASIATGVPVLGVCRGLQEMNVALGGSLYQRLHSEEGMMDHREPEDESLEVQFAERHDVELLPGSAFAEWAGATKAKVNSLHGQGIKRLGKNLVAEAFAPDGLVEGVRVDGSPVFAFGVQWHPEWHHESNPFYHRTLDAFAHACIEHRKRREAE
jgi:putative glutamine amidotransferase